MIRVLWLSDCSLTNNSGFSKVSLELLTRLSASGKFEIAELGINNKTGTGYKREPNWKVYFSGLKNHCEDVFVATVLDFKPDVVITLLDSHMMAYINDYTQVPLEVRNSFRLIAHMPIDGGPLSTYDLNILAGCNHIACIHWFGQQMITEGYSKLIERSKQEYLLLLASGDLLDGPELTALNEELDYRRMLIGSYMQAAQNVSVIPHGVDLEVFKPTDRKSELRVQYGIPEEDFVFCYFGRNSARKQQPLLMEAFKEVVNRHPKSWLILGCSARDNAGWDLVDVAWQLGLPLDHVRFTNNNSAKASEGLTDEQVAEVYQVSDCHVSTCVGGGFEICNLESLACGLPQIGLQGAGSIDLMVEGKGILVPTRKYYLGGSAGPYKRPLAKPADVAKAMLKMIKDNKMRGIWARNAETYANQPCFNWNSAASKFEKLIEQVMEDQSVAVEGKNDKSI
jgi:glycosyltransferase involved in cell wall biosynthesis